MSRKLWSLLLAFLLTLIFLQTNELDAYKPLVTIGKPTLRDILYSPDGRFLATVTRSYLELLDAETLAPVTRTAIANGYRLAFSPDSSLVAISGYDEGIQIWQVDSEMFLATIPVRARAAEFSPDGKYLAYANGDSVFLWDVKKRETVRELTGDPQPSFREDAEPRVWGISFHPDGRMLAVGSTRWTVSLWDIETAKLLSYLELKSDMSPNIMTFSHDGSLLAITSSSSDGGRVHLWDVSTGDTLYKYGGRFTSLAFTPDDRYLLAGGVNGNLHVIQIGTFSVEKIPAVDHLPPSNYIGGNTVERLTFNSDGRRFASLINDSRIRIWDAQDLSHLQTIYGYGRTHSWAEALYLPEINRIVTGKDTDVLHFWDATTGELLKAFEFYWPVNLLKAAPGRGNIIIDVEGTHQIWDADTTEPIAAFEARNSSWNTREFEFSPSGKYLASNGWLGTFIWDMDTGERLTWENEKGREVNALYESWSRYRLLKFTRDEKQILLIPGDQEKTVFWDIKDGKPVKEIEHIGPLVYVGTDFLQARRVNGTIEVRFLNSNRLLCQIPEDIGHLDPWQIRIQVQFHPSGNALAVHRRGDREPGECRFYNTWTGELISTIPDIQAMEFAADGSYMFLVDAEHQLGLYRTSDILGRQFSSVFAVHAFDKITTFGQIKKDQLLQNYPNPFNPETWIPYQLMDETEVTVCIHDSTGKLIRTFFLGNKNAGAYVSQLEAVHWDGKDNAGQNLASGVYFYSIQAEDFSDTRKMTILR